MRIRWPFVSRKKYESDVAHIVDRREEGFEWWGKQVRAQQADLAALKAELDRLREHHDATVTAKDEAYTTLKDKHDYVAERMEYFAGMAWDRIRQLDSLGVREPLDWAAPLPCWLSTVVTADLHGVRGEIGGMAEDETSDDPRVNLSLPMGISR